MTLSWHLPRMPTHWPSDDAIMRLRTFWWAALSGAGTVSGAVAGADASRTGSTTRPNSSSAREDAMTATPKKPQAAPDGVPKPRSSGRSHKSKVSEVQDPLIAGDAGKNAKTVEAGEVVVDEAGQVRRKNNDQIDLLH